MFELILTKQTPKRNSIICQRYFKINRCNMSRFQTNDFQITFSQCVQMIENALLEASTAFQEENNYLYYVKSVDAINPHRYSYGDAIYVSSEDVFYEIGRSGIQRIKEESLLRRFLPDNKEWVLLLSLYYNKPNTEKTLIYQSKVEASKYPREITSKICLTGKQKYWEHTKDLIYTAIKIICECVSSKKTPS